MRILMKIMLIMSVYSIKEILSVTTTTLKTPPANEIKKIKRGIPNAQPPSGHFHYYPFAHSQHGNPLSTQHGFNPIQQNIKPTHDNTQDSQFSYQNPQQLLPQENSNGYIGTLEHQTATISPYFPIAPLNDANHQQQYASANHFATTSPNYDPIHSQPAAQFPVHVEQTYVVASTPQQRLPVGQYHSTVQHPTYWGASPQYSQQQQQQQQQPIKYPTLLNGNKPHLYQQQAQYPVNNPGSVAPQQFLTNKNYYPQNSIRHYSQTNLATVAPIKYTVSSVLPLGYTTPPPLSAHLKGHPLLLPQYKKPLSTPLSKASKEQQKSKSARKEETEYDDDKTENKTVDHEDVVEDDDERSPRYDKPKYNSYRSYNNDNDDDEHYSQYHRYRDDSDDEDEHTSQIRDHLDDDDEADTAATSNKSKTKHRKSGTGKVTNHKYNKNSKSYSKSKPSVQKSSNDRPPKTNKPDIIEGKYSHQVPVTTDQKSKTHYQAKWYTYSSVNNNNEE